MGKVVVTLRVMPKGVDTNFDALQEAIKKILSKYAEGNVGFRKMPIAFGLQALDVAFLMPEREGGTDPIEKEISALADVSGVDTIGITLI